jgi:hypothetical protein
MFSSGTSNEDVRNFINNFKIYIYSGIPKTCNINNCILEVIFLIRIARNFEGPERYTYVIVSYHSRIRKVD